MCILLVGAYCWFVRTITVCVGGGGLFTPSATIGKGVDSDKKVLYIAFKNS